MSHAHTTDRREAGESVQPATHSPLVVVVDATNMGHILWHGSRQRPDVVEALPQRCLMLHRYWQAYRTVLCFDHGTSFRKQLSKEYKAHRDSPPAALIEALHKAANATAGCYGLRLMAGESLEADDWCASVAYAAVQAACRVVLVSADKDLRQCLLAGQVTIAAHVQLRGHTLQVKWMTAATLRDQFGVRPSQWVDYQALVGDATDGIAGAYGIGPAKATRLLQAAGTLDALLAHPNDYTANRAELRALWDFRERVDLVRRLLRLRTDAPMAAEVL